MSNRTLVRIIERERVDTDEAKTALQLQAKAWRLLAVIATSDPEYARKKVGWLMLKTVPFTDGEAVAEFIEEHQEMAVKCGKQSGVFAP